MEYHNVVFIGHLLVTNRMDFYWEYNFGELTPYSLLKMEKDLRDGHQMKLRQATQNEFDWIMSNGKK